MGILVRIVYSHKRQFKDVDYLLECIRDAWDDINKETLDALVKSIQNRCIELGRAWRGKEDRLLRPLFSCLFYSQ